ncbi:MAG: hypothetical protein A2736_00405 [Candidatus Yanofskybacteria bacterium RIFCSPHIGHO2_01_FULL_41_27]|uniref:Uncharacterized protein n=3 Tax=Patescibacteria group TaxID=1783273 RepID=A0A0G0X6U7_9BACT|nr:MAG: hypothetical protein UU78_C0052G0004 [Candidatus Roizmanbacteria bacterium GW2011_GWC2_41_7]KKS24833.1 MAG: hypothetical protein UU83_C0019G0010 [Candidatus Jorgensenbacteria bacterium GW2011_GWF2_41_8]OGN00395.1 MAG: hypothetical protein A2736_00405 [Candidatus Yanofskybacteria bacterium RIFCSPHIGHO2_01_FULL_41_27]
MAITVNWPTGVISVPKAEMTLVQSAPIEIRELNINTFRLTLKDLEDDAEGQVWSTTHNHNTTVAVGGVTLARVVEIINGYTVTFEDGSYAVNLVGANSNIADVVNLNTVSIRAANSAGLIQAVIWDEPIADHLTAGTTGKALSDAGGAGNPWGSPITGNTDAGTFGELVGKKLLTIAKFLGLK